MNQFNLGNFFNRVVNNSLNNFSKSGPPPNMQANPDMKFQATQDALMNQRNMIQNSVSQYAVAHTFSPSVMADLRMNNLANLERSLYVKDLMNLPKEMEEVLVILQKNAETAEETAKLLATNINLSQLSELIVKNGKEAISKLFIAMANASKQGITDLSQIKETIRLINASVAVAAQENPTQLLKSFMLLYLPWLPLQEGVDFDLEVESSQGEAEESETTMTVLISTVNYGNVKATLILSNGNSVSIIINCSDKFPKEELLKRINMDGKKNAVQSNIVFEKQERTQEKTDEASRQTKVSVSNLSEVSPFLVLTANSIIRNVIQIDMEYSAGKA